MSNSLFSGRPRHKAKSRSALAVVTAAALVLSGCGNSADEAVNDTDSNSTEAVTGGAEGSLLPEAEGETEYPMTLTTWAGESVLEERPERIALVGFSDGVDVLQALDVTPVYTLTEQSEWPWQDQEWFDNVETVDSATRNDPINFEGVAASDPDLIISLRKISEEVEFERLTDIAPVLDYESGPGTPMPDWRDAQLMVGEALDLKELAQSAVVEAEQTIDAVAEAHPEFSGTTIAYAHDYGSEYGLEYLAPAGGTTDVFLQELGFAPAPAAEEFTGDVVIPDENVGLLDADLLIVSYVDESTREDRENGDLFQSLPPVEAGRYLSLTQEAGDSENYRYVYADGSEAPGFYVGWVMRRGASALSLPWAADVIGNEWMSRPGLFE